MISIDLNRCKACGLCVSVCPKKALSLDASLPARYGSGAVKLTGECVECGSCYEVCPDIAITIKSGEADL